MKPWERRVLEGDFASIPEPFLWNDSVQLAHFLDGYAEAGSFERLAALANSRAQDAEATGLWRGSAEELWQCLFFEHRRWRHFGAEPEGEELKPLDSLCEALRAALQTLNQVQTNALLARLKP